MFTTRRSRYARRAVAHAVCLGSTRADSDQSGWIQPVETRRSDTIRAAMRRQSLRRCRGAAFTLGTIRLGDKTSHTHSRTVFAAMLSFASKYFHQISRASFREHQNDEVTFAALVSSKFSLCPKRDNKCVAEMTCPPLSSFLPWKS